MKKRIYTSDEEIFKAIPLFLLSIIIMIAGISVMPLFRLNRNKFSLFFVGGAVLLLAILQFVLALEKRNFHKECIKKNAPIKGEIIKTDENEKGYFLHIRIWDPETGKEEVIISDSYRIYVPDYLVSPNVQVYRDKKTGKYVIDGFEIKNNL